MKNSFLLSVFIFFGAFGYCQSAEYETIAENQEVIWDMEWVGQDSILYTELKGKLKLLDISNKTVVDVHSFQDIAAENQSGLMGLGLAHDFKNSKLIYVAYCFYGDNFSILSRISSFSYNSSGPSIMNESILVDSLPSKNANLGGRLLVDSANIYYCLGDIQNENLAQLLDNPNGKILRYNLDGTIPSDNPDPASPIFTYGHRNPQGICKTANGNILISEHGPFSNDEINVLEKGRNFGWPLVGGYKEAANEAIYNQYNIKEPILAFTPTIAPAGVDYYGGNLYPSLTNSLLVSTLKDKAIHIFSLNQNQDSVIDSKRLDVAPLGRIRDILVSPDGRVFASTSNRDLYGEPNTNDDLIVEVFESLFTSVSTKLERNFKVALFSNSLIFNSDIHGKINFSIYDLTGKLVFNDFAMPEETISLKNLNAGLFILKATQNNSSLVQKIIHQ